MRLDNVNSGKLVQQKRIWFLNPNSVRPLAGLNAWWHQANWKVWFSCKKKNVDGRNLTQCHSVMRPQRWPFNHLYFKQDGLFISKLGERFLGFRSKKSGNSTGKKHRNLEKFGFIFFCQFFNILFLLFSAFLRPRLKGREAVKKEQIIPIVAPWLLIDDIWIRTTFAVKGNVPWVLEQVCQSLCQTYTSKCVDRYPTFAA